MSTFRRTCCFMSPALVVVWFLSRVAVGDDRELHVVGVYEGDTKTGTTIHGGRAAVRVDRPGKRVILYCCAYERVLWNIEATPATTLERVILAGYDQQAAEVKPEEVPVTPAAEAVAGSANTAGERLGYCYAVASDEFRVLAAALPRVTGLPISSFHGGYRADLDKPFVADKVDDDPRLKPEFPVPTMPAGRAGLRFSAVHVVPQGGAPIERHLPPYPWLCEFTLAGPDWKKAQRLPDGSEQALLAKDANAVFVLNREGLLKFDLELKHGEPLGKMADTASPRYHTMWFDPAADQLNVLFTQDQLAWGTYDGKSMKWTQRKLNSVPAFGAAAFDPAAGKLYTIQESLGGEGRLLTFAERNAAGAVLSTLPLIQSGDGMGRPDGGGPVERHDQLVVVEGGVAWIAASLPSALWPDKLESRIYFIEPAAHRVTLTARYACVSPTSKEALNAIMAAAAPADAAPPADQPEEDAAKNPQDALAKERFFALRFTQPGPIAFGASYGEFTLQGPIAESLKPLPQRVVRLTRVAEAQAYFGLSSHDCVEIDAALANAKVLDMGFDAPKLSWPNGITYDRKRKRVLIATFGGAGYLYEYSIETKKWSVICELDNHDYAAIAYSEHDDMIYGVDRDRFGRHGSAELVQMNANGAVTKMVDLGTDLPLPNDPVSVPAQLVALRDKLVLIVYASPRQAQGGRAARRGDKLETWMYLIDPAAESIELATRIVDGKRVAGE
ncbi:MAG: hypothetical protein K1X74_17475 [Pirellulales bacterium]|nr:hypothetical protein [Pirellulales bacterium]